MGAEKQKRTGFSTAWRTVGRGRNGWRLDKKPPKRPVWSPECLGTRNTAQGKGKPKMSGKVYHEFCTQEGCHCACHLRGRGFCRKVEESSQPSYSKFHISCRDCGFGYTEELHNFGKVRSAQLHAIGWVCLATSRGGGRLYQKLHPGSGSFAAPRPRGPWLCSTCAHKWECDRRNADR